MDSGNNNQSNVLKSISPFYIVTLYIQTLIPRLYKSLKAGGKEVFWLLSQPTSNHLDYGIIICKMTATQMIFQGPKQMKITWGLTRDCTMDVPSDPNKMFVTAPMLVLLRENRQCHAQESLPLSGVQVACGEQPVGFPTKWCSMTQHSHSHCVAGISAV